MESYAGLTENDLSKITTVPNPFVVSSRFEVGAYGLEKTIQFHFLPPKCTIRIFNISGDLIQTIEHTNETSIDTWNLQSYNGQEVAFGVYFYHVDAQGIGEHIGKMAIIK
ncbi:MAG: T9SS type A sorting domain-containing protein [Bacteroidetes bacterium]|nr:T9SS type A sorting domain-containing protein [Bacteroidota bacterium]